MYLCNFSTILDLRRQFTGTLQHAKNWRRPQGLPMDLMVSEFRALSTHYVIINAS